MSLSLPVRKLALLGCLTLAGVPLAFGQASLSPEGGEVGLFQFLPGNTIPGDQTRPQAAVGAAGGFMVWEDNAPTPLGLRICAGRLDSGFNLAGAPFVVSSAARSKSAGDQEKPRVALLSTGGAVVVWQGGKLGFQQIYMRFFNTNGAPVRNDIRVSRQSKLNQVTPGVAVLASGELVVVWSSFGQDGSLEGIYARRFSASGTALGEEFRVNETTANNQRTPAIASLSNGRFVVAWVSELQGGSSGVDVIARVYDPLGAPLTGELKVNSTTNQICANPTVAGSAAGGFAVAWSQQDARTFTPAIDPAANGFTNFLQFNRKVSGRQAPLPNFTVPGVSIGVPQEMTARSSYSWDVYGRAYDLNQVPATEPFRVNTFWYGDQFGPQMGASGDHYFIVWSSLAQEGDSREGVFGQLLSQTGDFEGPELHINITTVNRQFQPSVTADANGRFLTLWSGFVRGGFDLFSRSYNLQTP